MLAYAVGGGVGGLLCGLGCCALLFCLCCRRRIATPPAARRTAGATQLSMTAGAEGTEAMEESRCPALEMTAAAGSVLASPLVSPPTCGWAPGEGNKYACFLSHYKVRGVGRDLAVISP